MKRERDWLLPCLILVAAQWFGAFFIAWSVNFVRVPPLLDSLRWTLFVVWPIAAIVVVVAIQGRWSRVSILEATGYQSERIIALAVGMTLAAFQMALLSWCKTLMPHYTGGFWADPPLADLDFAVFGVDPWRAIDWLPGSQFMQLAYIAWIPLTTFALMALFLSPPSRERSRAILAFFLVFAFGAFGQFLLPSAGPMFYHLSGFGDRFAGLGADNIMTTQSQKWLWRFHLDGLARAGGGISAMPSMHVAEAAWLALVCRALWPKLFWPSLAFVAVILLGSVYLGFHYASDGVVGIVAAVVIWWALSLELARNPRLALDADNVATIRPRLQVRRRGTARVHPTSAFHPLRTLAGAGSLLRTRLRSN